MRAYFRNLLRPWKVLAFLLGAAALVVGAWFFAVPTWDVGVSLLMAKLCFLLAPLAVDQGLGALRGGVTHRALRLLLALVLVYLIASGSYELYHLARSGRHPDTYWENLCFAVPVTLLAGWIWRFDGSLAELLAWLRRP